MLPERIVPKEQWFKAIEDIRVKEKEATKARDRLAAERRKLPWYRVDKNYRFDSVTGRSNFEDLFQGRQQLLLYHFMYDPHDEKFCPGCSMFVDQISNLAHLNARGVSFALVSRAPLLSIENHKKRMQWSVPWFSSLNSDFNDDFDITTREGETFALSVFINENGNIYRSYFTDGRGVEALGSVWTFLDLVPLGRQETWEDSPAGYPQSEPYQWWRYHDQY